MGYGFERNDVSSGMGKIAPISNPDFSHPSPFVQSFQWFVFSGLVVRTPIPVDPGKRKKQNKTNKQTLEIT